MSLHFSHQELQHVQSVILIHFALGSNKSAARLEIHLIPRPGTGRIKDAFHAANTCWGWTVRRSDPKTSGEIPLPTGNGIQYDSLYCSFWHIYIYIYTVPVPCIYIYITYIPNQENMANQHPINKMTQISQTFSDAASACHWPSPDVAPVIITRFPRISTSTSSPKPAVVVACHATSEAVFFGMCSAAEISKSSAEFRMRVW